MPITKTHIEYLAEWDVQATAYDAVRGSYGEATIMNALSIDLLAAAWTIDAATPDPVRIEYPVMLTDGVFTLTMSFDQLQRVTPAFEVWDATFAEQYKCWYLSSLFEAVLTTLGYTVLTPPLALDYTWQDYKDVLDDLKTWPDGREFIGVNP